MKRLLCKFQRMECSLARDGQYNTTFFLHTKMNKTKKEKKTNAFTIITEAHKSHHACQMHRHELLKQLHCDRYIAK